MRLTIERKALCAMVRVAGNVAAQKTTLPILSHVKLEAGDDGFSIMASNLDVSLLQTARDGTFELAESGATTVSCARLAACLDAMSGEDVTLKLEGSRLCLRSGDDTARLMCLSAEEFPPMLTVPQDAPTLQISSMAALCRVLPAASTDEERFVLNGVYFDGKAGAVVATNGRFLMKLEVADVRKDGLAAIVPSDVMKTLAKLAGGDAINMQFGENHVVSTGPHFTLAAKLVEGNYPNYVQVIPEVAKRNTTVETSRMLSVFPLAAAVMGKAYNVSMAESGGMLKVSASSPDSGDCEAVISAEVSNGFIAKFDGSYLMAIAKALHSAKMEINMHDELSPALIRDGAFTAVIMPMRVEVGV